MKIVIVGGGSGGHITPVLAVSAELKKKNPDIEIIYIGQKGDALGSVAKDDATVDQYFEVRAGKFRRYHGEGLVQFLDVKTLFLNIRDALYLLIGIIQSYKLLRKIKPSVIFSRGSYVAVPVSLAGKLNNIPYLTHDSDPVPSLANKIIAPWAKLNLTALPTKIYSYPKEKAVDTGIPLNNKFVQVSEKLKDEYRKELGIDQKSKVLFIIGGGQGAQSINEAAGEIAHHLLEQHSDLEIYNVVGLKNELAINKFYDQSLHPKLRNRIKIIGYTSEVYLYSGSADIVVTRAGATNLAEFAVQNKACIVIPGAHLTSGHQVENAEFLAKENAAIILRDSALKQDSNRLAIIIDDLLRNSKKISELEKNIAKFAKPGAAKTIADLILKVAN